MPDKRALEMFRGLARSLAFTACCVLLPASAGAVTDASLWATTDGSSPSHFEDHSMGHDDAQGPNGTFAVGRWSGNTRHGAYSGFTLPAAGLQPAEVRVVLFGYVTAPVQNNKVNVYLNTPGGNFGPLTLGPARLNQQVGAGAAGAWVVDFSSAYSFPAGALDGAVDADLRLVRQGPDDGAELHLDAVSLEVRLEDPQETFALWLGSDASTLDAQAPHLLDVDAPVDLAELGCPADLCFLRVRDSAGDGRSLSVLLLPDGDTLRVGFEDGREEAPVDADLSLVGAAATGPADGTTLVRVRVTPCDGSGLPLGEGVFLRLDPDFLGPAEAVNGFTHQGDGTYTMDLVAADSGDAVLVVEADGVALAASPVVHFVAP
jgi:hypothetical protein